MRKSSCLSGDASDAVRSSGLSLSGLTSFALDANAVSEFSRENDSRLVEYCRLYGKREAMLRVLREDGFLPDYDSRAKYANECIYAGSWPSYTDGAGPVGYKEQFERRLRDLYGSRYDELKHHEYADPRVADILIEDAIRTGRWKELPDDLQPDYHARVGGAS